MMERQNLSDAVAPADAVAVFKALGDPNRLRVFAELMRGDSCNCELADRLGMPANLLSHHLRALSASGLVSARRDRVDGRWIYYSVDRAAVEQWRLFLNHFLDTGSIQERILCGPEGRCADIESGDPSAVRRQSELQPA